MRLRPYRRSPTTAGPTFSRTYNRVMDPSFRLPPFAALLERDATALGDVYRRTRAGETPEQIQEARGTERSNFVWNYMRTVRALLDGDLPTAPTVSLSTARRFRRILSERRLSPQATSVLEANLIILERQATSEVGRVIEDNKAIEATEHAEAQAIQGIYV
jgi:hypothetical protein